MGSKGTAYSHGVSVGKDRGGEGVLPPESRIPGLLARRADGWPRSALPVPGFPGARNPV